MNSSFNLSEYFIQHGKAVESALDQYLPAASGNFAKLHESMRYSIFAGGKRLRPVLVIAAAEAVGAMAQEVLPAACAMEMIHTYSLIHDDLPCMDDDDLRRGRPTNHRVYGEALAVLAGDALLTAAFEVIVRHSRGQDPKTLLKVIEKIAAASGSEGMAGGQAFDLQSEKKKISQAELETLHRHKTGKLIQVALEVGGLMGKANPQQLEILARYGELIGLSFQIADDVLDIEGGEEIGKDIGSDLAKEKATYPSILGLEKSKRLAQEITESALQSLTALDQRADPLRAIAGFIIDRRS